jgi:hypothetical protein
MAITRDNIFNSVRRYLNRPNLADYELYDVMIATEGELNRLLRDHPRNRVMAEYLSQATGDQIQSNIPLPEDIASLVQVLSSPDEVPYKQIAPDLHFSNLPYGAYYKDRGTMLQISPGLATGEKILIDYNALIYSLSEGTFSNWITNYFPDLYAYGMLKEMALALKQDERFERWSKQFDRRVDACVSQGWNQNIASAPASKVG